MIWEKFNTNMIVVCIACVIIPPTWITVLVWILLSILINIVYDHGFVFSRQDKKDDDGFIFFNKEKSDDTQINDVMAVWLDTIEKVKQQERQRIKTEWVSLKKVMHKHVEIYPLNKRNSYDIACSKFEEVVDGKR